MAYVDDLAKDRDKYLRQRNQLMAALHVVLTEDTKKARNAALSLLKKIERSDPIANAVEVMFKD